MGAIKIYAQENIEKKEFDIHNNAYRNSAIKLAEQQVLYSHCFKVFPQFHFDFIRLELIIRKWLFQ